MSRTKPTPQAIAAFKRKIRRFFAANRRDFPWRNTRDPYAILLSEIMLQQTQTGRVAERYSSFLRRFPDFKALAKAPLSAVLKEWQGLGYNRRALYLKQLAERVCMDHDGILPSDPEQLGNLPGIGRYTAGAVRAFVFGEPAVFIETNIRSVFLQQFFPKSSKVTDREIAALVEMTLDRNDPREWYYALMDYGVFLKKMTPQINLRSAHYVRQKPFKGSVREVRGAILRALTSRGRLSRAALERATNVDRTKFERALSGLLRDGILKKRSRGIEIS